MEKLAIVMIQQENQVPITKEEAVEPTFLLWEEQRRE
jgi:hypothetical protein